MPHIEFVSLREQRLISALSAIITEVMDYPATKPISGDSYLPPHMITQAQDALADYADYLENQPESTAAGVGPLCIRCVYATKGKGSNLNCVHPQASYSLVDGLTPTKCWTGRAYGNFCGPRGAGFVATSAKGAI